MKTLELNQMENLQGGECDAVGLSIGLGSWLAGSILFVAAAASGPIGWVAIAGLAVGHVGAGAGMANACV